MSNPARARRVGVGRLEISNLGGTGNPGEVLTERDERRSFVRPTDIRPDRSPLARIRFLNPGPLPRRDDVPRPAADGALFLGVEASPEGVKVRSNRFGQGRAACGCWGWCESERGEEVVARFVEVRGARVQRGKESLRV